MNNRMVRKDRLLIFAIIGLSAKIFAIGLSAKIFAIGLSAKIFAIGLSAKIFGPIFLHFSFLVQVMLFWFNLF